MEYEGSSCGGSSYDDYDGQKKLLKRRKYINKMRAKELKDIKFGNTKTKVVSFHKG